MIESASTVLCVKCKYTYILRERTKRPTNASSIVGGVGK